MSDPEPAAPVWEPMLCSEAEDGEAPLSLDLLYHGTQISSPNDAIMVAAHLLMLETGFTSQVGLWFIHGGETGCQVIRFVGLSLVCHVLVFFGFSCVHRVLVFLSCL